MKWEWVKKYQRKNVIKLVAYGEAVHIETISTNLAVVNLKHF